MKKTIIALSALLLLLSGCSGGGEQTGGSVSEPSLNYESNRAFNGGYFTNICATEDTVYFATDDQLFYFDKATGITGPLCGKPECQHNDSDCNAYLFVGVDGLSNYNGRLYWVELYFSGGYGYRVSSVAYDGTDRRVERTLDSETSLGGSGVQFHRGYVYLAVQQDGISNGVPVSRNYIYAFPLGPDVEPILILDEEYTTDLKIQLYGDSLYIASRAGDGEQLTLRRWDIKTETTETLFDSQTSFNWRRHLWVTDNEIFLDGCVLAGTDKDGNNVWQDGVYRFDFTDGEFSLAFSMQSGVRRTTGVSENMFIDKINNRGEDVSVLIKDLDDQTLMDTTVKDTLPGYSFEISDFEISGADEIYLYLYHPYSPEAFIAVPLDGGDAKVLWSEEA